MHDHEYPHPVFTACAPTRWPNLPPLASTVFLNTSGNICDGTSSFSCPLIASASPEVTAYGPTLSTRDHQTGDLSVIRAGVAGAMLHCTGSNSDNASDKLTTATTVDDVRSFFRVVHAGNHMPIRGSQFRVKRMQGSDILAEVS